MCVCVRVCVCDYQSDYQKFELYSVPYFSTAGRLSRPMTFNMSRHPIISCCIIQLVMSSLCYFINVTSGMQGIDDKTVRVNLLLWYSFFFFFFFSKLLSELFMFILNAVRTRHARHCWKSKNEFMSDVLLWTPTRGQTSVSQPAKTYIHTSAMYRHRMLPRRPTKNDGW